ncbi:MAG: hypothetical protein KY459_09230 [Acidobacteria bacterium]|nr:hypothetical protein [Acidobacteriota bacterium]
MEQETFILCPSCGNDGNEDVAWERNAHVPFRLVECVLRSWDFEIREQPDGSPILVGDTNTDTVDWESGDGLRLECCACFNQFSVPEGLEVDFEWQ